VRRHRQRAANNGKWIMKLQTRLTATMAAGVALVILGFQTFQSAKSRANFSRLEETNRRILTSSLSDSADSLGHALDFGISQGIASGDMDVFKKVTQLQKELRGLKEVSLYNEKGAISFSSDSSRLKAVLDPDLKQQLFNKPKRMIRESTNEFVVYEPCIAAKSCIGCHTDWKESAVVGVTLFRCSKDALSKAEEESRAVGAAASANNRWMTLVTVVGSLILIIALVAMIIRPVIRRLGKVVDTLQQGTLQTTACATQVSSAAKAIAEGASGQAAAIEETGASLVEVASMTKSNSENSGKANDLAKEARSVAERGAADMEEMNTAMKAIQASSDDISKIIKTIDELAFQTNILALNAAVEAARAGEAGMGFAVVAEEVRSLAQRSARSAKETEEKIQATVTRTAQGVRLSAKVAANLQEILAKVRQVDELVAEVASASREQSQGIDQVNQAVSQVDKVTQTNAAVAQESASAAEQLNAQAASLHDSVNDLLVLMGGRQAIGEAAGTSSPLIRQTARTSTKAKPTAAPASPRLQTSPRMNRTGPKPTGQVTSAVSVSGDFKDF
jgi:hypothetical protein